jgi:hypothetical protein
MRDATWVVIDRRGTDSKALRQKFPAMPDVEPQETKRFQQALDDGFELVAREGAFELRRRRDSINQTVCADIAK